MRVCYIRHHHLAGACKYTLMRDNCEFGIPKGPADVLIIQKNWRGYEPIAKGKQVSWAKEIAVRVFGHVSS